MALKIVLLYKIYFAAKLLHKKRLQYLITAFAQVKYLSYVLQGFETKPNAATPLTIGVRIAHYPSFGFKGQIGNSRTLGRNAKAWFYIERHTGFRLTCGKELMPGL